MLGITLRAAATGALMTVLASILGRIMDEIVPLFNAPNSMLATTFNAVDEYALVIGLLSALMMLIANAVVESEVPR